MTQIEVYGNLEEMLQDRNKGRGMINVPKAKAEKLLEDRKRFVKECFYILQGG